MFKEKEYWMPNNDWDYEENDKIIFQGQLGTVEDHALTVERDQMFLIRLDNGVYHWVFSYDLRRAV